MPNAAKVVAHDPYETPKETWQYVTVPDEDLTGQMKFPTIWLNKTAFEAGQTYHLPVAVADYVKDRIKAYNRSVTRLFSPQVDRVALREVAVGTASPTKPTYVDATQVKTQ